MMTHIIDWSELQGLLDSLFCLRKETRLVLESVVTSTKETSSKEENIGSKLFKLLTSTGQLSSGQDSVSGRFHPYKDISSPNSLSHYH